MRAALVTRPMIVALVVGLAGALGPWEASAQSEGASITGLVRDVGASYAARALAAERAGRMLEAEVLYLRALETDPGLLVAWLGYARALDARRHREEALRLLAAVPRRAYVDDAEAIELARAFAALGQAGRGVVLLRERSESALATRALVDLTSAEGRFPEALAAARRLVEIAREPGDDRAARVLVRALTRIVADADAVECVPAGAPALRRLLRGE